MSKTRYYFATDSGTQWFSALIAIPHKDEVDDANSDTWPQGVVTDVPIEIFGGFLGNICQRDPREIPPFNGWIERRSWGWSLSELEYNRVKRLVELLPAKKEYDKLSAYNV